MGKIWYMVKGNVFCLEILSERYTDFYLDSLNEVKAEYIEPIEFNDPIEISIYDEPTNTKVGILTHEYKLLDETA